MTALKPTPIVGKVTWLGVVADRVVGPQATKQDTLQLSFAGADGESHSGLTRPSCMRILSQYPQNTEIRNCRQVTIVSEEELKLIAVDMGMESVDPSSFGASIVVQGIPDFTHVPPSSRLQTVNGTTLTVDMLNTPCSITRKAIQADNNGLGETFKAAAFGRRGVTAWVEREGSISIGDSITVHIPDQRAWKCSSTFVGFVMNEDTNNITVSLDKPVAQYGFFYNSILIGLCFGALGIALAYIFSLV